MGATACGGKADSKTIPHSSANIKVWGGALSPWNIKINWGLRNVPWADGWSVGSRYSHNLPGLRFKESPADDNNDFSFSAICTGIHGMKSRPKACCHCPFNKREVLNWFMCAINARNLSWAGVEQGGHPEWVRSLWETVSRKRGMASPTTALMQHKSTAILQWEKIASHNATIWTLLRGLIRTRTHGEMVISTDTDF